MGNNVTILSFSNRNDGNCAKISQFIANFYKQTYVRSYFIDCKPCGNCNYECLGTDGVCPGLDTEQVKMMDELCGSDLVYFVIPNFCGFPCANYFAFNERSAGYFGSNRGKRQQYITIPKRFIIVSNTEGFEKALQQQTNSAPVCLYLKSGKYGKRSTAGDILDSEEAISDLLKFLEQDI